MANEIEEYIREAREKDVPDEQIKATLMHAGWPQEEIDKSIAKPSDGSILPPPPPPPIPHIGMWTGFLYIILFISLYISATSIASIFHVWIEKLLPSTKDSYSFWTLWGYGDNYILNSSLSALVVSFPIFAGLAIYLKKQLLKNPLIKNIRSRKILIYITLVGTFLIMISHLITTIYEFLNGSGTTNALGHLAVTLLVAGPIFLYFISEVT